MVVHDGQVAVEVRHVTRLITVNDILAEHVSLDVSCLDRIYLNGYLPTVQVPGQVVQFLQHRGFPIPSPAVVEKMGPHETAWTRFLAVSRALLLQRMNNERVRPARRAAGRKA